MNAYDITLPDLRLVVRPEDTNHNGTVFGGFIMAQADLASSIVAIKETNGVVVTRAVKSFEFLRPAHSGNVLSFYCEAVEIGITSIAIEVVIRALDLEKNTTETELIATASIVFVAIDENGKPREIKR